MQEKESNMRLWIGETNLTLGLLFGITRQSLVMPSNGPRDRIAYPIHKLMIDSYNPSVWLSEMLLCRSVVSVQGPYSRFEMSIISINRTAGAFFCEKYKK